MMAEGLERPQIAERLGKSPKAAGHYMVQIRKGLGWQAA